MSRGKRYESARRLSLIGLDKPNTRNREDLQLIAGCHQPPKRVIYRVFGKKVKSPKSVCSELDLDAGEVGREHHASLDSEFPMLDGYEGDIDTTLTPPGRNTLQ
jgi:hypothetical protein